MQIFQQSALLAGSFLLLSMLTAPAHAAQQQGDQPLPSGTSLLAGDAPAVLRLQGQEAALARVETVDVTGQPFDKALRVQTSRAPGAEWHIQLVAPTARPVEQGDVLLARFWLRCDESMTGDGFTTFVFEEAGGDYAKAVEQRVSAGGEWQHIYIPFQAPRNFAPGQAQVALRAGFDRQTIDIGGLEVLNLGKDVPLESLPKTSLSYAGRSPDAPWRREALERIETLRKGDLRIRVVDADGKPVPDARVHASLQRHAFGFGSAVTAEHLTGDSPDAQRYQQIVEQQFNTVVFENDMKWPALWDGVPPQLDEAVQWLEDRQMTIRGHNLIWPSWRWLPQPLRQYEGQPEELRRRAAEHIRRTVGHFEGRLVDWDVVNEPYSNHDLMDILGQDVMVDWFKIAKAADPGCRMFLNDYGILEGPSVNEHRQHFYDTIKYLRDQGAPIDGIGIQSHFGSNLPPPTQVLAVLDQFSEFGLPIVSTELSLNLEDRQLQADYLRDYLIALFSHPQVEGVMLWGFWEGRHWRPQGALYDRDWSLRPHGQVWNDLVHHQWKTDARLTTDQNGHASVRGFLGDYEVQVESDAGNASQQAHLERNGTTLTITLPRN